MTNSWQDFYNNIRDASWPNCNDLSDFKNLPQHIQDEIVNIHNGKHFFLVLDSEDVTDFTDFYLESKKIAKAPFNITDFPLQFQTGDITVYYGHGLDGGGTSFGQDYPRAIKYLYSDRQFNNCLEWCCGPGFIGFRLLSDGICRNLYLNDCFGPAIKSCQKTISNLPTRYEDCVKTIHTGDINDFDPQLKFDLIVANPPHFQNLNLFLHGNADSITNDARLVVDQQWKIHKNFFANIHKHLLPDAKILLQENINGSGPWDFEKMIEDNGFTITRCFILKAHPIYWYCEIQRQH
jgi:hypothetical protein